MKIITTENFRSLCRGIGISMLVNGWMILICGLAGGIYLMLAKSPPTLYLANSISHVDMGTCLPRCEWP